MKYLVCYETKWTENMDWKQAKPFPISAEGKYDAEQRFRKLFSECINTPETPTELWINRVWALDKSE